MVQKEKKSKTNRWHIYGVVKDCWMGSIYPSDTNVEMTLELPPMFTNTDILAMLVNHFKNYQTHAFDIQLEEKLYPIVDDDNVKWLDGSH